MTEGLETADVVARFMTAYRTTCEPPPPRDEMRERHVTALALELTGIYPEWSKGLALNESNRRL